MKTQKRNHFNKISENRKLQIYIVQVQKIWLGKKIHDQVSVTIGLLFTSPSTLGLIFNPSIILVNKGSLNLQVGEVHTLVQKFKPSRCRMSITEVFSLKSTSKQRYYHHQVIQNTLSFFLTLKNNFGSLFLCLYELTILPENQAMEITDFFAHNVVLK